MISWLKGSIIHIDGNEVVVNAGGVGYQVFIGENLLHRMRIEKEQIAEIVVYTAVREDEIRLFGFDSFLTKKLFSLLLGVNGVGPKMAVKIVDFLSAERIIEAITNEDAAPFTMVSGVGKKTAGRIVLDLAGKIENWDFLPMGAVQNNILSAPRKAGGVGASLKNDALSALVNLGFPEKVVDKVILKHLKSHSKLDDLIKSCLADLHA